MKSITYITRTAVAALILGLVACASTPSREQSLMPTVNQYNDMVRWKRGDLAAPLVVKDEAKLFRDWSEEATEKYEFQSWHVREVRFESPVTAVVEIERKGFIIPKYVEEKFRVEQQWVYTEDVGWRIRDGF